MVPSAVMEDETTIIVRTTMMDTPNPLRRPDHELAHILWRTAKQLVSLLEKRYGFGNGTSRLVNFSPGREATWKEK